MKTTTHHVVDIFEDCSETTDDQGELVLGDVDQTFLVVLCADFGVSVLVTNFDGKLRTKRILESHHQRCCTALPSDLKTNVVFFFTLCYHLIIKKIYIL